MAISQEVEYLGSVSGDGDAGCGWGAVQGIGVSERGAVFACVGAV
jgi:hypothetical protein